jgi:hypothetical protein
MLKLDLLTAFETQPAAPEFAWPGFQCGTVGLLTVPDFKTRTRFALQVAAAVASGQAHTDTLGLMPEKAGGVLFLSVEDTSVAVTGRLHELAQDWDAPTRAAVAKNLEVWSCYGTETNIMSFSFEDELLEAAAGKRLLIIDNLKQIFIHDTNGSAELARAIARIETVAAQSGAAILVMNPEPTTAEQRVAWSGRLIAQGDRVRLDVRMRGGPSTFVQDFEFAETGLLCQARELEAA